MKNICKFIFSYLYFFVSSFYSFLFRVGVLKTWRFNRFFVISVGNLTVGGSGKTPFIILLSNLLLKQNIKHAIVSRGYKKNISGNLYLLPEENSITHSPDSFGDEPYMLFNVLKKVPVFVGDKIRSLLKIPDVFDGRVALIDDGYQTHNLFKNINVLLLDCSLNLSSYKILPLGLLREPLKEIKKADFIILTKTNLANSDSLSVLKKHFDNFINLKKQAVFSSEYLCSVSYYNNGLFEKVNLKASHFNDIGVVSVCGIANPKSFKSNLKLLNLSVLKNFVFSDHYKYSSKNTKALMDFCVKNKITTIITTLKDFYKIQPLFDGFDFYVIDVQHHVFEYEKLKKYFKKKLTGDFK